MTRRPKHDSIAWVPGIAIACFHCVAPAASADENAADIDAIAAEMASLRAMQAEQAAEMQRTDRRLTALEAALARLGTAADDGERHGGTAATGLAAAASSTSSAARQDLRLAGDFRARYEWNSDQGMAPSRARGVIRGRLQAGYAPSDRLYVGAMLSTGDPSNPRTGDVTLTGFGADLQVKLAQAYIRGDLGSLQLWAGKMPQPFQRTELVWDGDVNPQGVAARYRLPWQTDGSAQLSGLYFIVDEAAAGADSYMVGGQLSHNRPLVSDLQLDLSAAYYDYTLRPAPGSSAGTFRGNLVAPGGGYLSDFDLVDGMVAVVYEGMGPRWPVRLGLDYVRNLGAAVADDSGFAAELTFGRASQPGDWRAAYGYAETGVDAVLAAFSSDNTDIATNYLQHTLAVDYVISSGLTLNATAYRYRPMDASYAGSRSVDEWINRFRLNLQVTF